MGNFLGLCVLGGSEKSLLRVMKMNDGKILEFRTSMKVRDLLVKYPNSYVGMFKEATQPLPLDYKLKLGKVYYLLPCFSTRFETSPNNSTESVSPCINKDDTRRVKVVITRKQLEQILSNQMTLEDVIMEVKNRPCKSWEEKTSHLQKLEAIPEEIERY